MADRATQLKWLEQLTNIPTASGLEWAVVDWVTAWGARRGDLSLQTDSGGNLLITQKGRKRHAPVLAVAHMDHPAFVITTAGRETSFEFRGGVDPPYFHDAAVEVVSRRPGPTGRVVSYLPTDQTGVIRFDGDVSVGEIAMWQMATHEVAAGRFAAPACDDLAGVAAALSALDRARSRPELRHFGVLLTRAEEVGLIGAIHAAKNQTIPTESRLLSIETSRELPDAPIGAGPIIRTGDRVTVFDRDLTNRISRAVSRSGIKHQRKLMSGGGCEATAFGAYGYAAGGLCLALANWHNRGNLTAVENGTGAAIPMLEEIDLEDYHGLVDLLLVAAEAADTEDSVRSDLDGLYEAERHHLTAR